MRVPQCKDNRAALALTYDAYRDCLNIPDNRTALYVESRLSHFRFVRACTLQFRHLLVRPTMMCGRAGKSVYVTEMPTEMNSSFRNRIDTRRLNVFVWRHIVCKVGCLRCRIIWPLLFGTFARSQCVVTKRGPKNRVHRAQRVIALLSMFRAPRVTGPIRATRANALQRENQPCALPTSLGVTLPCDRLC